MRGDKELDLDASVIDSRDIIERMEWLEGMEGEDDRAELAMLEKLAAELEPYAPDWKYGAQFIADSYFQKYAEELAADCGEVPEVGSARWPLYCIDWEYAARELKHDYSGVEINGSTYWVR